MKDKALIARLREEATYDLNHQTIALLLEAAQALAAPVQEPVKVWDAVHEKLCDVWHHDLSADEGLDEIQDLIATPSAEQRTWVGLTDEEKGWCAAATYIETVSRIEAKLKDLNT